MPAILEMNQEELLALWPEHIKRILSPDEMLHIFKKLGGFWNYDYQAAENGKPGFHALLKSGRHSDAFIYSKAALRYYNICRIMAQQLVWTWERKKLPYPNKVAGIPTGATKLGEHVAHLMKAKPIKMTKENGKIKIKEKLSSSDTLLLVEDFCTQGTGFKEAVADVFNYNPRIYISPYELVIINRGILRKIATEMRHFEIISAVNYRINEWDPDKEKCPLCNKYESQPIKPKATEENWEELMNSQN